MSSVVFCRVCPLLIWRQNPGNVGTCRRKMSSRLVAGGSSGCRGPARRPAPADGLVMAKVEGGSPRVRESDCPWTVWIRNLSTVLLSVVVRRRHWAGPGNFVVSGWGLSCTRRSSSWPSGLGAEQAPGCETAPAPRRGLVNLTQRWVKVTMYLYAGRSGSLWIQFRETATGIAHWRVMGTQPYQAQEPAQRTKSWFQSKKFWK